MTGGNKTMKKQYIIKDNQFILYPRTSKEINITEEEKECKYCKFAPKKSCGHYKPDIDYPACDWFTLGNEWEDITEEYEEE